MAAIALLDARAVSSAPEARASASASAPAPAHTIPRTAIRHKRSDGKGEVFYELRNLALLRCFAGLTQHQVALAAWGARGGEWGQAIWPKTIGELERRRRSARTRTLAAIANGLGVDRADLCRPLSREECEEIHARLKALKGQRVAPFSFRDGRPAAIRI